MHSSGMHTTRLLTVPQRALCKGGASAQGEVGVCRGGGGCLPMGVCPGGVYHPLGPETHTPPWTDRRL